jgi:hypothetical protein
MKKCPHSTVPCLYEPCQTGNHCELDARPPSPPTEGVVVPRLYLDCDGVLADFDRAFEERFGHPPREYEDTNGAKVFWRDIKESAPAFYRHLPLMAGARELFESLAPYRPIILTGCPMGGWAEMQKLAWAAEHFPGTPMVTCMSRDKRLYCRPGDVLVDDMLKYRDRWEAAGGVFVHYTGDPYKAIAAVVPVITAAPASSASAAVGALRELVRLNRERALLDSTPTEKWTREHSTLLSKSTYALALAWEAARAALQSTGAKDA